MQIDQTDELPWAQAFFDHLRGGEFLDWDPNAGAGIPAGIFPLKGVMSPFSVAYLLTPGWYAVGLKTALSLLFCQAFTYLLLRRLGAEVWPAVLGGVAYTFLGSNLVLIHRISAFFVVPAIMWAMHRLIEKPTLRNVGVAACFVGWSWFEGFPSGFVHSLYITLAWCSWLVLRSLKREQLTVRAIVRRAAPPASAVVLGVALGAVTLLPFAAEVTERGILAGRLFGPDNHLPLTHLFGLFDPKALGLYPEWVGEWWSGGNPVESVTHIGMAVALAAAAGLLAAALGRIELTKPGRSAWSFACGATVLGLILMFVGGPLLGAAYRLPGLANNAITRGRYVIGLGLVLVASLAVDHFWRHPNTPEEAEPRSKAPRLASAIALAMLLGLAIVAAPDYVRGLQRAGQGDVVKASLLVNLTLTLGAVVLAVLSRYSIRRPVRLPGQPAARPTAIAAFSGAGIALLLFVQLGLPFRDFTPSAPVRDYYTEQKGHAVLRELLGERYRFTGSGRFTFNLNSAQLLALPDLRAVGLHSQEFRNLIKAIVPKAFDIDPFRVLVIKEAWDLDSPLMNDLAVRFVALGTDEMPYGRIGEEYTEVTDWVSAKELLPTIALTAPGPVVGVSIPLSGNDSCASGHISLSLKTGEDTVAQSTRPSFDLLSDWLTYGLTRKRFRPPGTEWMSFALKGESIVVGTPYRLELTTSNPDCEPRIGVDTRGPIPVPARKILVPDPSQPIRLASTEQAWIYERTQAWELISAHTRWRSFPTQAEALAFAARRGPDELDVVAYEGFARREPAGGTPAAISSIVREPGNTRFRTSGAAESLVVVSENIDDGWGATVDGNEVPIVKVDGALLGVFVPAGRHEVELNFLPVSFRVGRWISLLALLLIAVFFLPPRRRFRLRKTHRLPNPESLFVPAEKR